MNVGDLPLGGALYLLAPVLWTLGLDFVPQLGSTVDPNGIAFDESFSGAVQSIYDGSVGTDAGTVTDAVFSHEAAIAIWTLMNVNNPDFSLVLQEFLNTGELLPYTGQVVVDGSPGDWSLVSWDGTPVPQDPGLAHRAVRRLPRPDHRAAVRGVRHLPGSARRQLDDDRHRDSDRSQPNRHGARPVPRRGVRRHRQRSRRFHLSHSCCRRTNSASTTLP